MKNNKSVKKMLFFGILLTLQVFMFKKKIFQLTPTVLLNPTNCYFRDQVIPPLPGVLGIK